MTGPIGRGAVRVGAVRGLPYEGYRGGIAVGGLPRGDCRRSAPLRGHVIETETKTMRHRQKQTPSHPGVQNFARPSVHPSVRVCFSTSASKIKY